MQHTPQTSNGANICTVVPILQYMYEFVHFD